MTANERAQASTDPTSRGRFRRRYVWALGMVAALWAAVAWWLVPRLIASAYRGTSFAAVNALITGQRQHAIA